MFVVQTSDLVVQTDFGRDAALRRPVGAARRPCLFKTAAKGLAALPILRASSKCDFKLKSNRESGRNQTDQTEIKPILNLFKPKKWQPPATPQAQRPTPIPMVAPVPTDLPRRSIWAKAGCQVLPANANPFHLI
jgi:hypothetical protein